MVIESGATVPLARLIKVYASYVCNKDRTAERFSDIFHIRNCQKSKCSVSPLHFNFALKQAIRSVQEDRHELKLTETSQPAICDD
jgi:hypothetical protein